jgi:Ca-activated chloride channel family protein
MAIGSACVGLVTARLDGSLAMMQRSGNLFGMVFLVLFLSACSNSADWWLTADQQGQRHFQHGEFALAARSFERPMWKGISFYAAQDFGSAAAIFAGIDSAASRFYLGNTFAHRDMLAEAVTAYQQALQIEPDFEEAQFNLDWVAGLLELEEREYDDYGGTGGKLGADGFVFDDRAKDSQQTMTDGEAAAQGLTDAQIEEIWMRRVQTTPADFLAIKFSYQLQAGDGEAL